MNRWTTFTSTFYAERPAPSLIESYDGENRLCLTYGFIAEDINACGILLTWGHNGSQAVKINVKVSDAH